MNNILLSKEKAELIAERISKQDGKTYKFFRFLNLAKLSLCFMADDGQRVITVDHAKEILREIGG